MFMVKSGNEYVCSYDICNMGKDVENVKTSKSKSSAIIFFDYQQPLFEDGKFTIEKIKYVPVEKPKKNSMLVWPQAQM